MQITPTINKTFKIYDKVVKYYIGTVYHDNKKQVVQFFTRKKFISTF